MDSQTNLNANTPFSTGLEAHLHPLLAEDAILPSSVQPISLLATPQIQGQIQIAPLSMTADGILLPVIHSQEGAVNPTNRIYAPLSATVTSTPLLNGMISSLSISTPTYAAGIN